MRRDALSNRKKVLDAAEDIFARHGLGVTLNDVAHKAGLGVGTVYRNFPNKSDLLTALFIERLQDVERVGLDALAIDDPGDALDTYFEGILALQTADRALNELISGDSHQRSGQFRALIQPAMEELLARAQDSGEIRADIAASDLVVLLMMLSSVSFPEQENSRDLWRRYLVLALSSLRAHPSAPESLPGAPLSPEQASELVQIQNRRMSRPRR